MTNNDSEAHRDDENFQRRLHRLLRLRRLRRILSLIICFLHETLAEFQSMVIKQKQRATDHPVVEIVSREDVSQYLLHDTSTVHIQIKLNLLEFCPIRREGGRCCWREVMVSRAPPSLQLDQRTPAPRDISDGQPRSIVASLMPACSSDVLGIGVWE